MQFTVRSSQFIVKFVMKNYSSNRAQKGKTAYRTPSLFKANKAIKAKDIVSRNKTAKFVSRNFFVKNSNT